MIEKWKKLKNDEIKKRRGTVLVRLSPWYLFFSGYLINKFNYSIRPVKHREVNYVKTVF